jgi:lipopolysaccharide cholinephosphotransferase
MTTNVRRVQLTQLRILKDFMKFCGDNKLRYFIGGGALIGVLRHKGFIPWDDDIDIAMPRPDYDKFISLQNKFPNGYSLTNHDTDKNWQFNFSQFVDDTSEIIVHMNEEPRHCKVWIDIFPMDGTPNNPLLRWLHIKHIMWYRYLIQIPNLRTQVDTHKVGRPWYEKLIIKCLHYLPIGNLINVDKELNNMERSLTKYDYDKSLYVGDMLGKYREKEIVPKSYWGTGVMLPFEDIDVPCPSNYDALLTHIYGNYMQMPPVDQRVSHDIEIIKLRGE